MIYLTGDTHGGLDIEKLNPEVFPCKNMTKDDYVIILGDFGFIWNRVPNKHEFNWFGWFNDLPWTTLFIDGNHENHRRLSSFPVDSWHGGQIHRITNSVYHLMRGQVFEIDGHSFFTMGGAHSVDIMYRRPGISWWSEELPSEAEYSIAINNLEAYDWTVDYVLTHELPTKQLLELDPFYKPYPLTDWLNGIRKRLDYKQWYCGHHHLDCSLSDNVHVLYNDVKPLP